MECTCIENWIWCYLGLPVGWTFKIDTIIAVQKIQQITAFSQIIIAHRCGSIFSLLKNQIVCNVYGSTHGSIQFILIWINQNKLRLNGIQCQCQHTLTQFQMNAIQNHWIISIGRKSSLINCFDLFYSLKLLLTSHQSLKWL